MSATRVGRRRKFLGFRWSKEAKITLETIIFWQDISISIFKFSPFLSIKSHQFFKIYWCFGREREKTLIQSRILESLIQSMRKEKMRKVRLCFITEIHGFISGCFIKPFKMILNHFFKFLKLIRSVILAFWYQGYQKGKLGAADS